MKPDTPSHPPGLPNLGPLQEPGTPPPPAVPPLMATALQAEPEPLSPAESLKLSLGAVPPRVCVIGPKGGGKTIYRLYLANQLGTFPSYLARMFGTEASPWGDRPGEELTFPVAGDAFRWEEEATLRYHTDRHDHYLPAVRGTNWITRHRIDLPFLQGDSFLLDFPGEFALRPYLRRERELKPYEDDLRTAAEGVIGASDVIVFILPFWTLFPAADRLAPPPHLAEMTLQLLGGEAARRADPAAALELERQMEHERIEREDGVMTTAASWLSSLNRIASHSEHKPMLLVVFSMLGSDWCLELKPDLKGASLQVAQRLAKVRNHLTHELTHGARGHGLEDWITDNLGGAAPLAGLGRALDASRDAAHLASLMTNIERELRMALRASRRAWSNQGAAGSLVVSRLGDLLDGWRGDIRYTAMNIITERAALFWPKGSKGNLEVLEKTPYYRTEPAGPLLPSVYLAGALER